MTFENTLDKMAPYGTMNTSNGENGGFTFGAPESRKVTDKSCAAVAPRDAGAAL